MHKDLFTTSDFYSLASASGMVFVICNAVQAALNFNPKWLALLLSEAIAIFATIDSSAPHVPSDYFITVLNGCLIYCTSIGGSTLGARMGQSGRPKGTVGPSLAPQRRSFLTCWF